MKIEDFKILGQNIPPFSFQERGFQELEESYFKFYGLNKIPGKHFFGLLPCQSEMIAIHYFEQKGSNKTAILKHGYYTHSGYVVLLAEYLADLGYNLICYDMPGHGLSSGSRLEVESFSHYRKVLEDILVFFKADKCQDHELISFGHSTGAIPIFDAALNNIDLGFSKSFLLAPLIRTNHYKLARISYEATKSFLRQIKRKFRRSSHDEDFLHFIENDPLQERFIPNSWLRALFSWNDEFEKLKRGEQNLIVLQGDQDGTVEWKTNLKTIRDKFPKARTHLIKDAEHQLMNESSYFMEKVFKIIKEELA